MIFCVCNRVSDREMKALSSKGHELKEIYEITGAGSKCGACLQGQLNEEQIEKLYLQSKQA